MPPLFAAFASAFSRQKLYLPDVLSSLDSHFSAASSANADVTDPMTASAHTNTISLMVIPPKNSAVLSRRSQYLHNLRRKQSQIRASPAGPTTARRARWVSCGCARATRRECRHGAQHVLEAKRREELAKVAPIGVSNRLASKAFQRATARSCRVADEDHEHCAPESSRRRVRRERELRWRTRAAARHGAA